MRLFKQSNRGLYYLDTAKADNHIMLVSTIEQNKSKYSSNDYKCALLARKVQILLGRPTLKDLLWYIDNNLMKNCPVDRQDTIAADDIFGNDLGRVKGKTT